jgi:hypothetical protein
LGVDVDCNSKVFGMKLKNFKSRFGTIILVLFLICSGFLIILPALFITPTTNAGSTKIHDSESDFINSTLDMVTITPEGDVKLALISDDINDNFKDLSKINYRNNIAFKSAPEKIALKLNRNTYGGMSSEMEPVGRQTADGGYIVTGYSWTYTSGACDVWLLKIDSSFKEEWNRSFGGANQDGGFSVDQTTDGGYFVTGMTDSFCYGGRDAWVIKTYSNGTEEWSRTLGGNGSEFGSGGQQTVDGGYIVAGWTNSYGHVGKDQYGGSYSDVWLVKLNSTGHEQWNKTYGWYSNEYAYAVEQTSDNGYIITGVDYRVEPNGDVLLIKTDSNGTEEWNNSFRGGAWDEGCSVHETPDGGYIIGGYENYYGNGGANAWLIKTNSTGQEEWNKTYNYDWGDFGDEVQLTSDGGYILVGYTRSTMFDSTVWLIKTDSLGNEQWNKTFGPGNYDFGYSVTQTPDDGYVVFILTDSYGAGSFDFWLIKIDSNGNCITNGTLISKDLLENREVITIDEFHYQATIPDTCQIQVQFSQDNINWYNSTGVLNGFDNLSDGFKSIDLSALNWIGPNIYYKMEFYSFDIDYRPSLQNIQLFYKEYNPSGTLKSKPIPTNGDLSWKTLAWESTEPEGTNIKFKLCSANKKSDLESKLFLGPNGDPGEFYTASGTPIWSGQGQDKWMQYMLYLDTNSNITTPILHNVTFSYNYWPEPPILIAPTYNNWTNNNKPTFTWQFNDTDSANQQAFQVLISNDSTFETINFDSSKQKSKTGSWTFPTGTSYNILPDDNWYWKVRTQDSDGDWGPYSESYSLNIDTNIEKPVKLNVNSEWTNYNVLNIDWVNPYDSAGIIEGAYYYLGDSPPNSQDDGIWMSTKPFILKVDSEGVSNLYLWLEDNASNKNYLNYNTAELKVDTYPPHSLEILINNGDEVTNQTDVVLTIEALDNTSGVDKMAFSTDGDVWSEWEEFSDTKEFELQQDDGQKNVYMKVMDRANNIAGPVSTSIILNTTEPEIDTDDDGYPDDMDDFPDEPTQWLDSDGDNYGDNPEGFEPDAFPNDPNEWLDSDGDNYGDNSDEFPNDPTKWKKDDGPGDTDKDPADKEEFPMFYLGIGIVIVVIVILLVVFLILKGKKKGETPEPEPGIEQPEDQSFEPPTEEGDQQTLEQQQTPQEENISQDIPAQTDASEQEPAMAPVYCPSCGLEKSFVQDENRYYCDQCQIYD